MDASSRKFASAILLLSPAILSAQPQNYTTLVTFNAANGAGPAAPLIQASDGNYYGTTNSVAQSFSGGTIFKMTPSGTLTTLYTFGYSNGYPNGANPGGLVQGADGNFYGTTNAGGAAPGSFGTVFKLTPSGTLTTLYSFSGTADGSYPANLIQASDGNFYGTTSYFGPSATIFRITPAGVLTTIYRFGPSPPELYASSLIQASDGNLYGTMPGGGANGGGAVFKLTLNGTMTPLYSFGPASSGPVGPQNIIQGKDGNFYGTTAGGVFKLTPLGAFTALATFASINLEEGYPNPLMQARDGNFYGTTYAGGDTNRGVVFQVTPLGAFRVLFSFPVGGGYTKAGLIQGSDGNLYGTTNGVGIEGAIEDDGTIFRVPLPAYTCTNRAAPVITSVSSASDYGAYPYFTIGSWLEIKGTNLADPADPRLTAATNPGQWTLADFDGQKAPALLDGISATIIDGGDAYPAAAISYLSPTQINVQAPGFYLTGAASITVTNCNATSLPFSVTPQPLAPGFLAPPNYSAHGTQYMVATFASDGAYVLDTAAGATLGVTSRPAKPGDLIIAYGIGFGDTTPYLAPGYIAMQSNTLVNPVTMSFGSTRATLSYEGLAGGFVGLYEFYITVPPGLANGDYQINVMQNGAAVPQTLYLTIHN